ncbi:haloacid dehalogenase type II [Pseudomonas syringae Cit 7]|uniref:Haloacid dehalogenase type II n=1 Tax=Pseudomonas syringae Cit 7 TaxID=629264 RepID=A0A8T8M1Z7_PSESX|nr:haloacid dehalogenase type II [Pseudomonas syringae]MCK9718840.1 haloacid dehalogenase type II [Pseudomonas syringae pv. syringae]MCK9762303.1 haloacid dehalogenase type II [Pseudomonas syringae pv. syringae]NAO25779.1 haloacid dehalogenase type II [Pseudomonas syringae pv. dysoxyli]PBP67359.1 haloacid dehalogenase, type II [Pseudomonas syringae]QUP67662.1 haloacid dehalogenase type II [Pseudomonas syringae Cit 7]
MARLEQIGFLGFDVFGTVVDWRNGVARAAAPFLQRHGVDIDPLDFADQWRSLYQPSMQRVRAGERPYVTLDVLNRESLETVLARHEVDFGSIPGVELAELNKAWERLDPWPDSVAGLTRLKRRFSIGTLSNGHIAGMLNLAKFGGLPWDVIVGAEIAGTYKPMPQTYLKSAKAVGLAPHCVAMVAAHNADLTAARANGFKTVFVRRPAEHGPGQTSDLTAEQDWDVIVDSLTEAADALDC